MTQRAGVVERSCPSMHPLSFAFVQGASATPSFSWYSASDGASMVSMYHPAGNQALCRLFDRPSSRIRFSPIRFFLSKALMPSSEGGFALYTPASM